MLYGSDWSVSTSTRWGQWRCRFWHGCQVKPLKMESPNGIIHTCIIRSQTDWRYYLRKRSIFVWACNVSPLCCHKEMLCNFCNRKVIGKVLRTRKWRLLRKIYGKFKSEHWHGMWHFELERKDLQMQKKISCWVTSRKELTIVRLEMTEKEWHNRAAI